MLAVVVCIVCWNLVRGIKSPDCGLLWCEIRFGSPFDDLMMQIGVRCCVGGCWDVLVWYVC